MKNAICHNSIVLQRGLSLIIVLILLVVIGVTAASAMRNATSSQMVTNNIRMDNMALQYSEAALRYCESELQLADTNRVSTLQNSVIPTVDMRTAGATGLWENTLSWTGASTAGFAAATRTSLSGVSSQYSSTLSSYTPATAPECVAEIQTLGTATTPFTVMVVTSRGFSSDYKADSSGTTIRGSVVWLQSILNI